MVSLGAVDFELRQIVAPSAHMIVDTITEAFREVHRSDTLEEGIATSCAELRERARESVPPFSMRRILAACNATVVERPIATEGRLEIRRTSFSVAVRPGAGWRRKRFTIAHEIGHILLLEILGRRPGRIALVRDRSALPLVEWLCNAIAAELLMPRIDVWDNFRSVGFTAEGLRILYDRYLCSHLALYTRLKQIIPNATITLWRQQVRHLGDVAALRVVKCYRSFDAPWLPVGISSRHLDPDVVREACETGSACAPQLRINVRGRDRFSAALAVATPQGGGRGDSQLPIFEGLVVPDEPVAGPSVVLLLLEPGSPVTNAIWTAPVR
jgi:hypothetical protein